MASERIDELLVGLGLDVEEQSFQRGMSAFAGIRSAALSAAGAIGVSFGVNQVAEFTSAMHGAFNEAQRLQTSVGYLTQIDDAFRMAGESGADATAELGNMVRLMDEFTFNRGGAAFNLAAQVGLEPSAIADAENVMDAYELLIDRASRLGPEERRVALESLGFGAGTTALSQAGPDMMSQWMARSEELAGVTDEMVQQSIDFNQKLGELNIAIRGLSNEVLSDLIPPLTALAEFFTDWISERDERREASERTELYQSGESAGEAVGDAIMAIPRWLGFGEDSDSDAPGMDWSGDLFRGGPDRGADSWIPDIWPETLDAIREMQMGAEDVGGWGGESPAAPSGSQPMPAQQMPQSLNADTLESIRARQERGEFRPSDMEYLRQQMRSEFPEQYQGAAGNVTFNISGVNDPQEVARVVDQRLRSVSMRTAEDYRSSLV